jgi:hypothetical protein
LISSHFDASNCCWNQVWIRLLLNCSRFMSLEDLLPRPGRAWFE